MQGTVIDSDWLIGDFEANISDSLVIYYAIEISVNEMNGNSNFTFEVYCTMEMHQGWTSSTHYKT